MARMPHEKADARARAQTLIGLELARYRRRLVQTAEDHISMEYDRITAAGGVFDHELVADAAIEKAKSTFMAGELPAGDAAATA